MRTEVPKLAAHPHRIYWRHIAATMPLVHVPFDGEGYGRSRYALAESWIGPPPVGLDEAAALRHVTERYLAAFGPASVEDLMAWAGRRGTASALAVPRSPSSATGSCASRPRMAASCSISPTRRAPTSRPRHRHGSSPDGTASCSRTRRGGAAVSSPTPTCRPSTPATRTCCRASSSTGGWPARGTSTPRPRGSRSIRSASLDRRTREALVDEAVRLLGRVAPGLPPTVDVA